MEESSTKNSVPKKLNEKPISKSFLNIPKLNIMPRSCVSENEDKTEKGPSSQRAPNQFQKLNEKIVSKFFSLDYGKFSKAKDDSVLMVNNHWKKLKESLFESINKRFHIKEKAKKKELPKVFPLESLRISRSSSYYHLEDQLFVIIDSDKFIFFTVYKDRKTPENDHTVIQGTKKILKKILNLSNYFVLESANKEEGYCGTIAYEVRYDELYGMEFTNSLLQDSCRIVTECRKLYKKCFNNVEDMLTYYGVEFVHQNQQKANDKRIYFPIITKDKKDNTVVSLKRMFPKCEINEFNLLQGVEDNDEIEEDINRERDFFTEMEAESDIDSTDICEKGKLNNLKKFSKTPQPKVAIRNSGSIPQRCEFDMNSNKSSCSDQLEDSNLIPEESETLGKDKEGEKVEEETNKDPETLLLNERIIKQVTVQAYFDDPLLPYRMREVIVKKENKQLLRHYETSLPSWTVVMATYGYYRPSFRKFQYWFMMFISLISMMIGFFDLYKNLPIVKPFLKMYMESIWDFLEDHVILRMSVFLGYLVTNSPISTNLAIYLMQLPFLGSIWNLMEYVVIGLQMFTLPFKILKLIFQLFWSLLMFIVIFPYAPMMSLLYSIKWGFLFLVGIIKTFGGFIKGMRNISKVTNEIKDSATFFQMVKDLFLEFGRSSFKKFFDGIKAVYNTVAYIGSEIGKYRYSILRFLYEKFILFLFSIDNVFTKPGRAWLARKLAPERLWNSERKRNMLNSLLNISLVFCAYHFITGYFQVVQHLEGFRED